MRYRDRKRRGESFVFGPEGCTGWTQHLQPTHQSPHFHPCGYELHYFTTGSQRYMMNNVISECAPGTFVLVPPQAVHCPADLKFTQCCLLWIRFTLEPVPFPALDMQELAVISATLAQAPTDHALKAPPGLQPLFEEIFEACRQPTPFSRSTIRACLGRIVTLVCLAIQRGVEEDPLFSPEVERALRWIDEHFDEDTPILSVADHVRLSLRQFHERFRRETGYTPNEYRIRQRINQATDLISTTDLSFTKIAFQTGFSSSQYFATVFKRILGCSPREFKSRHL